MGLSDDLQQVREMMESLKASIAPLLEEKTRITKTNSDLAQQIEELRTKRMFNESLMREIDEKMFDAKRQLRELEAKDNSLQRQAAQEEEQRRLAAEFQRAAEEYDNLTKSAYWREFALDHQIHGARILANAKKGILGDKMGLGKTLTSLAWLDMLQAKRALVITPRDITKNFEREIRHWTPNRNVVNLAGMTKIEREFAYSTLLPMMDQYIIVVNYESWRKDLKFIDGLIALGLDAVICDEAHRMKNKDSINFRGVQRIVQTENACPKCGSTNILKTESAEARWRMVWSCENAACLYYQQLDEPSKNWRSVKYVLPMTGTPILNKPQELWTLLNLVDEDNFPNEYSFLRDYCIQDVYDNKWHFRSGGMDMLIKRFSNRFVARDRKAAGIVLPKQEVQIYDLELTEDEYPDQMRVMKQLNKHAQILLDDEHAMNILYVIALITRKRQAVTWPAGIKLKDKEGNVVLQVDAFESIKIDRIIKHTPDDSEAEWSGLLPEMIESGERVVVFSQFKEVLAEIDRRCKQANIRSVRYDGDTSERIKDEAKMDFDRKYSDQEGYIHKWDVLLANYKAGGVGANFTAATQMIIVDEEWNPGNRDQAYGRLDRIGQTEETTVHVLRVKNTIDSWMANIMQEKENLVEGFESATDLAQQLRDAIVNGDML